MKYKILALLAGVVLLPLVAADFDLTIMEPDQDSEHDLEQEIYLEWISNNNFDVDRVIHDSEIMIEGDSGRRETIEEERGNEVASESQASYQTSVSTSQLDSLDAGEWTIEVRDYWGEYDAGEVSYNSDTQADDVRINADDGFQDNEVDFEIGEPNEGVTLQLDSSLGIEVWTDSEIDTEVDFELEIQDESQNDQIIRDSRSVVEGEERNQFNFDSPLSQLDYGKWELSLNAQYGGSEHTEAISFAVEETEDAEDDEGQLNTEITQPDSHEGESDLAVEWTVENTFSESKTLETTYIEVSDRSGRTESFEETQNLEISSESTEDLQYSISEVIIGNFDEGSWELVVEDEWGEKNTQDEKAIEAKRQRDDSDEDKEEDDEDADKDDSEDSDSGEEEETDGDESDQSDSGEEEETDGDESDQSEHADSDDEVLDQETGDEETVDDESDVDTEDSDVDTEDSDVDTEDEGREDTEDDSESFDSGDESDEGSEQGSDERSQGIFSESLDAVAESSPVIWLALAALLGVFMFWRSDYKLDF